MITLLLIDLIVVVGLIVAIIAALVYGAIQRAGVGFFVFLALLVLVRWYEKRESKGRDPNHKDRWTL